MRVWLDDFPRAAPVLQPSRSKEIAMKTLHALLLATLVALSAPAFADDASAKPRTAKAQITAVNADAPGAPKISQQDKMRQCAKQATGKKGAERKAFMKGCLSKKKA
jgi:hypothetical protein